MENGCLSKASFSMLVSGGIGIGKTEFTKKLLKSRPVASHLNVLFGVMSKYQQDLFEELMEMNVEYMKGIPRELNKYFKRNERNPIILGDLLDEASKSLKVIQLFARAGHGNLSVIYLKQHLFQKNQHALNLNSDYMVIFKNLRVNSQFATIARQIRPDQMKFLMLAYKHHLCIPT